MITSNVPDSLAMLIWEIQAAIEWDMTNAIMDIGIEQWFGLPELPSEVHAQCEC